MNENRQLAELQRASLQNPGRGERLALLLERRRRGLLDDDKLRLAAYLGDPDARELLAGQVPSEGALRQTLDAPLFQGLEARRDRAWERALTQAPDELGALLDRAAVEPRLRRLFPKAAVNILRWSRCDQEPATASPSLTLQAGGPEPRWQATPAFPLRSGFGRQVETREAIDALLALLPARPGPVWLGDRRALPRARARLGAFNDALGPEAVLAGLSAWPRGIRRRAFLALARRICDGRPPAERPVLDRALRAYAAWILNPSLTTDAARAAEGALSGCYEALRHESLGPGARAAMVCASLRPDRDPDIESALAFLAPEATLDSLLRELAPWALGDRDPLEARLSAPAGA